MNEIEMTKLKLVELNSADLNATNGGGWFIPLLVAVGLYMIYEGAGNPRESYNSFINGWNAAN